MDRSLSSGSYYWPSRIAAAVVLLLPLSIHKVDFRSTFGNGLAVTANKSSPAYAAFEDLKQTYATPRTRFPEKMETLAAGQRYQLNRVVAVQSVRAITLKGLIVRSPTERSPQPFYVAGESLVKDASFNRMPLVERKRVLAERVASSVKEWTSPTVAGVASNLVRQELNRDQRVIQSSTGNPIIVAKVNTDPAPVATSDSVEPTKTIAFLANVNKVEPTSDQARALWLNGQIEMTGGLAFIGSDQHTLVIKRIIDGTVLEKGRIWINEGRFEIYVKNTSGQLVAELLARTGRVLGRGEINLIQLRDLPTHDNRIYDLRIAVRPTTEGASLRAVSAYSHGQQIMPVRQARIEIQSLTEPQKVNDDGVVTEASLSRASSYVARASAPKHWSSLVVGQAEQPQDIRLFSDSLVEALIGLEVPNNTDRKEARMESIVWGQVRREGKPVSGATVEMAGTYRPIYFNEYYLPDATLTATSENGLFAFVKVRRGVQAIRVLSGARVYPAQIFPTEDKHVSYVQIALEDKVVTEFKVLDVMSMDKPIEARVRLVGTEEIVPIQSRGFIEYSNGANPFLVEVEAGVEYEVSRVTLTGRPQVVRIPMVRHDWLTDLYKKYNVFSLPGRGIIVGYVDDQDFEVELTGYAPKESMQVVYFDSRGQPVAKNSGVAGGGFVIFNAPMGLQTLYIHAQQSRETYAQVVVAEPEYVNVMTWSASR